MLVYFRCSVALFFIFLSCVFQNANGQELTFDTEKIQQTVVANKKIDSIQDVEISEVTLKIVNKMHASSLPTDCTKNNIRSLSLDATTNTNQKAMGLPEVSQVGELIWKIITIGKAVINADNNTFNVLPTKCWMDLTGWKKPVSKSVQMSYKNMLNKTVAQFQIKVTFVPGGQFKGKGQYLSGISIIAEEAWVQRLYQLDVSSFVYDIRNNGSQENPIASVELVLSWTFAGPFDIDKKSMTFVISGDGTIIRN